MNRNQQLARLKPWVERAREFSGWDLGQVRPKMIEPRPPWDYETLVPEYAVGKRYALDMGTGGGELLSRLRRALPYETIATEEWNVNAPIAKRRLGPLGVELVRCGSRLLPFENSAFDLVINRHEELDPREVARVLSHGGHVVTQQVGRDNWRELRRFLPRATDFGDLYGDYMSGFEAAGLTIIRGLRHDYRVAYRCLGELTYLLTITPWTIPGFSLERDLEALLSLESECLTDDGLVLTESRFLIIAAKRGD
jgi:SAM-dependent methyltransferase